MPLHAQPFFTNWFSNSSQETKIQTQLNTLEAKIQTAPAQVQKELKALLPLLKKTSSSVNWGKYHELSGKIANNIQDHEKAIKSYFKAAEFYQKSRNYSDQSNIYLALGDIFHQQWNHQKAIDYYQIGLETFKFHPVESKTVQIQLFKQLGRCYLELDQFKPSLTNLWNGKILAKKTHAQVELCNILQLIGQNYQNQHLYSSANRVLEQAKSIANAQNLKHLEMTMLDNLSRVNLKLGDPQKAKTFAFKKRAIAEALHNNNCINISNYLIAKVYLSQNRLDSALSFNSTALKRAQNLGRDTTERDIWIQQGAILAKQNRAYPAILALEKAQNLEDKLASNAQRLKAERLRQEMTIRRAEKQLKEHFESRFRMEGLIRFIMFTTFFLAALLSLYYLFKVRIRQKANRQLKEQNAQIESQKNQLEQLSQVKDQLFAVISHDLRSPLWAIQAVLDTLNEPDLPLADRNHWLELLHQQTAKTSVMLENLLYWAKIQMNSYQATKVAFKLQPIVEDLSEFVKLIFAEKAVQIKNEISPGFTLYSDPGVIRMALRNIIANAVKFSHNGQVVEIFAQEEKNGWAIQIKDHGIGMNEEQLHKSLNGQLSRFGTKGEVGSGMGLSLVKQFIENQGGELIGQAKVNQGCLFTITLPFPKA